MTKDNECVRCGHQWQSIGTPPFCPVCYTTTVFSKVVIPATTPKLPSYGQTRPTVSPTIEKPDCRDRNGIATGCNANEYTDCKYGKKGKDFICWYHHFGLMCDKVTLSDGTEVN